jgi:hypothetical protein
LVVRLAFIDRSQLLTDLRQLAGFEGQETRMKPDFQG